MTDQFTSGAAQYRAVLGNSELVALLVARLLSGIGDQLARVVLALYVLERSDGNALLAAMVLAISYVPSTFGFAFLGSLADRFPRRSVMLWADLARALLVTMLAIAVARDANFTAVVLLLVAETFSAPAVSARSSLLPDAARSPVEYQAVVGLGTTFEQVVQVLGFILAGVALGVTSAGWVLLFNALTFLISYLIVLAFVAPRPAAAAAGTSVRRMLRDAKSGLRTIVQVRAIRGVVFLLWGAAGLLVATDAVALPYAADAGAPPWAATALLAATPAGAALGALIVARLPMQRQVRLVFPLAIASMVPLLATAVEPPVAVTFVLWTINGLFQGYIVTLMALSMQLTPEHRRGRVFGVAGAGFNAMAIVGLVGLGAVAERTSPAAAVVLAGAVGMCIVVIAAWAWPHGEVRSAVRATFGAPRRHS
ncbi:MAG: MFS transporter [Actinomycetia bacterium]|nr:MFS transporter [Actinomycetes bacterium]